MRPVKETSRGVTIAIWNYIRTLGVDRDTALDLYQIAQVAVWEAATTRATRECQPYLVKTAIGAIRHYLRDKHAIVRVPAYLHDRGQAAEKSIAIMQLDDITEAEAAEESQYEGLLQNIVREEDQQLLEILLPRLSRAQEEVMRLLLKGLTVKETATRRGVKPGCVYAQRSAALGILQGWIGEIRGRQADMVNEADKDEG